jgi:YD repeat-containing protein
MHNVKRFIAAVAIVAAALAASAQEHANQQRGFVADKVYNFSGIDSVNVFNGNLTLTIPIGAAYPVSSVLSQGITLSYNSKVWDYQYNSSQVFRCGAWQGPGNISYPAGHPYHVNNAGFGWTLSMGRLLLPENTGGTSHVTYIAPDGSSHGFSERPRSEDTFTDWSNAESNLEAIGYSFESNLRLKKYRSGTSGFYRVVEFPDGTRHTFTADGYVSTMQDRFGNMVLLTRGTNAAGEKILSIHDPQHKRTSEIVYKTWTGSNVQYFNTDIVDRIELSSFTTSENENTPAPRAVYQFKYHAEGGSDANAPIDRACKTDYVGEYCDATMNLPVLRQLILPDGSKYKFDYNYRNEGNCEQGTIKEMVLPTGGTITWKHGDYWMPANACAIVGNPRDYTTGVREKTLDDGTGVTKTWKYNAASGPIVKNRGTACEEIYLPGGELPYRPERTETEYVIKSFTDPLGRTTQHFFSTWTDIEGSENTEYDYGLPFTRTHKAPSNSNRHLSRVLCKAGTGLNADGTPNEATCVPVTKSYITYHFPNGLPPGQSQSELTLYSDGNWVDADRSSPDGFGHFRKTIAKTNFPSERSITTEINYNPGAVDRTLGGKVFFKAGDPWITGTYTSERVTQQNTGSTTASESSFCFDSATGVLKAKRVYKNPTPSDAVAPSPPSTEDIVVRYTYHDIYAEDGKRGFLDKEDWYGGDGNTEEYGDLCGTPAITSKFQMDHTHHRGALKTTQYRGADFLSVDNDIDRGAALVKATRDSAGVVTTFAYDKLNRLTEVAPLNREKTTYQYSNADYSNSNAKVPASVLVLRGPDGAGGTRAKYEYDGIGRLTHELELMPSGLWSTRETTYDSVGRRKTVSEMGNLSALTTFTYDDIDRPKTVKTPDGAETLYVYNDLFASSATMSNPRAVADVTSPRFKSRIFTLATPGGDKDSFVTEEYDGLGRLIRVTEKSGPTTSTSYDGGKVLTDYTYDQGNRLTDVLGNSAGDSDKKQTRTFKYDGRGFLSEETHPENGTAKYRYDSRGHVISKDVTSGIDFDLSFTYDSAERLTTVTEGTLDAQRRPIKSFQFGSSGSTLGKLWKAIRFNYPEPGMAGQQTIKVTETYEYDSAGRKFRRLTDLATESAPNTYTPIVNTITQTTTYNSLDLPDTISYPTCNECGVPATGARNLKPTYKYGRLDSIPGFVVSTAYNEAGLWRERVHANQVRDVQLFDPSGMPRPYDIQAFGVVDCAVITSHPKDFNVVSGGSASFGIAVSDTGATYQWYRGVRGDKSSPIAGETASTLTVTNITVTSSFWCEVKSGGGCIQESNTAQAIVCTPTVIDGISTTPDADENNLIKVDRNREVTVDVVASGTSTTYTWTVDDGDATTPVLTGTTPVIRFTANKENGTYTVSMTISGSCGGGNSVTKNWTVKVNPNTGNECTAPTLKSSFPDIIRLPASRMEVYLDIELPDGAVKTDYRIQWLINGKVVVKDGGLSYSPRVENAMEVAVSVAKWCDTAHTTLSPATTKSVFVVKPELCAPPLVNLDQKAIDTNSQNPKFTATTAWPDAKFVWYEGDSGNTRVLVTASRVAELPREQGSGSVFMPNLTRSATYWVRTYSSCGLYADSETLTVTHNGCPPVRILRQPMSVDSKAEQQQTLSFEPAGTPEVHSVEWYIYKNNTRIPDSNNRYQIVTPRKTTGYYAKAYGSNSCSTGGTDVAWVRVTSCDLINVQSITPSQMITKGNSVELNALATSTKSLTFDWFEGEIGDGTHIGSGTALTRTPPVTTKYYVRITAGDINDPNASACAIDREVVITVCDVPKVTLSPFPAVSVPGYRRWLGVEASGTNLTYQWYEGAKGDTSKPIGNGYAEVQVAPYLTTDYWVKVSNACGSDQSESAKVSVPPGFTSWPSGGNVTKGTVKTLTVVATGNQLKYQWYRGDDDSQPIAGATSATYTTPPINADVTYWARVWSGDAWLNVPESAVFTVCQPRNLTINPNTVVAGTRVALGVELADSNELYEIYEGTTGTTTKLLGTLAAGTGPYIYVEPTVTTSYWVRTKKGSECYADSPTAILAVCVPKITTQPQGTMVNPNTSATLTVATIGDAGRTYQWYEGSLFDTTKPVAGGTGATLTTPPLTADTTYWVAISNPASAYCSNTTNRSSAATVTVCKPPAITTQPISTNKPANSGVTLSVTATGTELTYQWYVGAAGTTTSPVTTNGTSASLNVNPTATTSYWVKIGGRCGSVNSNTAKVYVYPVITAHPVGGNITKGTTKTLSVVATGNELTYQWFLNDTAISGATAASYTTPPINADATYSVTVSSGNLGTPSNPATLTVCLPRDATFTQTSTVTGSPVTLSVVSPAAGETYDWYRGASGVITAPIGSGTSLTVYPTDTTQYWVRTKRSDCNADSAAITVPVCRPKITTEPPNASITQGQSTTLTVAATGPGTLTYQWYIGDTGITSNPIGTCTGTSCAVTPSSTTKYWVRVTSPSTTWCYSNNSTNSATATVTVCQPPAITVQPMPQNKPQTGSATLEVTATGTGLTYQWYEGASGTTTTPVTNGTGRTVSVAPAATTQYWVKVSGGCGTVNSIAVKVYVHPVITVHPASASVTKGTTRTLSVTATGNELTYQWYLSGTAISGATAASYTTPPINADATYSVTVSSGNLGTPSNPATLTVCLPRDATFTQTSTVTGSPVTLSVVSPGAGETFDWYRGASGVITATVGSGTSLTVYPTDTTQYWVRTRRSGCDADSAAVTVPVCRPKITTEPANASITQGQSTTLSVAATGPGAMTYQWYIGDTGVMSNPIGGCTGTSCAVTPSSTTKYWVRVTSPNTNWCYSNNSTNSVTATVTVCQPPAITVQPMPQNKPQTGSATLEVTATGAGLAYQWYEGPSGTTTSPVTNGTGRTVAVAPTATTQYWVKVSGTCGSVNSIAVKVYVHPVITVHPASASVTKGTTRTLSVTATGNELAYQWYTGQTAISGATASSYTTPAIHSDTSYWVNVSSGNLGTPSNTATLTVCQPRNVTYTQSSTVAESAVVFRPDVFDTATETYHWYRGASGDTSQLIGTGFEIVIYPTQTATYWLRTTRAGCYADSAAVTVAVCYPKINTQPASTGIVQGQTTTLSVAAVGPTPMSYQWYIGSAGVTTNPIASCTGPTCAVAPASTTTYWVKVSGPVAGPCAQTSVNSTAATVTVCQPASITSQPQNRLATSTGYVTVSVTTSGSVAAYQWYEGTSGVTTKPVGTNSASLTVQPGTTKYYWVRVTSSCGTVIDSTAALVSVYPVITAHPEDKIGCLNAPATFSVTATGNPSTLTYQWYRQLSTSGTAEAIGTNSPSVTVTASAQMEVWVVVTSGQAVTNSNRALLTTSTGPYAWGTMATYSSGYRNLFANVIMEEMEFMTFAWYEGRIGDTTRYVSNGSYIYVYPFPRPKYWWVRVTDSRTGCYTDLEFPFQ